MTHQTTAQDNLRLEARIAELERQLLSTKNNQENEHLRKLVEAEHELLAKQNELDESIAEVLVRVFLFQWTPSHALQNWVPQALSTAHDERDRNYKQLRAARSESFLL